MASAQRLAALLPATAARRAVRLAGTVSARRAFTTSALVRQAAVAGSNAYGRSAAPNVSSDSSRLTSMHDFGVFPVPHRAVLPSFVRGLYEGRIEAAQVFPYPDVIDEETRGNLSIMVDSTSKFFETVWTAERPALPPLAWRPLTYSTRSPCGVPRISAEQ